MNHLLSADRSAGLKGQNRQDHPLLERAQAYSRLAPPDPQRSEHANSQPQDARIIHMPSPLRSGLQQS
jgi:hypothetical protein